MQTLLSLLCAMQHSDKCGDVALQLLQALFEDASMFPHREGPKRNTTLYTSLQLVALIADTCMALPAQHKTTAVTNTVPLFLAGNMTTGGLTDVTEAIQHSLQTWYNGFVDGCVEMQSPAWHYHESVLSTTARVLRWVSYTTLRTAVYCVFV